MTETFDKERMMLLAQGVPEAELEAVMASGGEVWDTNKVRDEFEVLGFLAPFVTVRRKADGQLGSLMFTHHPRFYYGFTPDR